MPRGWCPFAVARPTKNFGYPAGTRGQNKPLFFVDHIMEGWKQTLDRGMAGVGVTFGIGLDGSISQYTSIFDAHWGNGLSGRKQLYDRSNSRLASLEQLPGSQWIRVTLDGIPYEALIAGGVNLPNSHSISTEHEGFTGNAWPQPMVEANIRVKRWCLEELARAGMPIELDSEALVGHFQIDGVHRVNCPGTAWAKDSVLQALGEPPMIRKNGIAKSFEDRTFAQAARGVTLEIASEFKLPATARQVRVEVFMASGGVVVRDGTKAYAGQVSQLWNKQHGEIDVLPKDGTIYLDFEKGSKVKRIGCLGYLA
ncbi:MAG: hypothetical protein WD939_09650 [Dehalococcoidia bacterium]